MKTVFAICLSLCSLTFAGQENAGLGINTYNPKAIYNALKVKAIAQNPGIVGASRLVKSVGGLTCTRSLIIVPHATPSYDCAVDQANEDFEKLYKALRAKEVNLNPGIAGSSRIEKAVGGLSCIRSMIVVPNATPSYECTISE